MAIPADATYWTPTMDPGDVVDYTIDLSAQDTLLGAGENVASFTATVLSEGIAVGFELGSGAYAPTNVGNVITLWFQVNPANQADAAFTDGVAVPIELEFDTDSTPARTYQRTFVVNVKQL